jgi:hypothetical protein
MSAKKHKLLRKMAHRMVFEKHLQDHESIVDRKLMVHPPHEKRAREQGHMRGVTAVNYPKSTRGIYRWLKRNYDNAET